MKRVEPTLQLAVLLKSARRVAVQLKAAAIVLLADVPYDFAAVKRLVQRSRLVIASDKPDVQRAAREDGLDLVPLLHEPETRQLQLSQALLEAIADELLQTGDKVV